MKLTAVLLTLAFLQVQAHGLGQEVTLDVKGEKLEKVLSLIEKQTGYVFFTTADLIKKARPVTLQVRNEALAKVLDLCFKGQALDYVIDGKTISVVERKAAHVSNPISANTEQVKKVNITGRVVNEKDEPVAGATVMVKGSTYATATDEKGEFRLEEIEENSTLIISGANIETNEVKIRGRENVAIKVQMKIGVSEAVVVTVNTGYQNIPKERATGSFAQPDKEMFNARVSTDVLSKMEGITSGLVFNVDENGKKTLSIRGRSTILANEAPLIVLDNFPYDGDINSINPNDIENVTLLKDAAAASIWGAFAGNGVIVITTKKGKTNTPLKVNLNSNFTITQKPDLFYSRDFLSSSDFIDVETFLFDKGFYDPDFLASDKRPISPVVEILKQKRDGTISQSEANTIINTLKNTDIRNDLNKYFYQRATKQQYSLSLNGGSTKSTYLLSVGIDKNAENQVNNNYSRITISSFNTYAPVKHLELSGGIYYIQTDAKSNSTLEDIRTGGPNSREIYPYAQLTDDKGNPISITKDYRTGYIDTIAKGRLLNWKYTPLTELELANNTTKSTDLRLLAGLKYSIIPYLNVEIKYQYQKGNSTRRNYNSFDSYYTRDFINRYADFSGNTVRWNIPLGGILDRQNQDYTSSNLRGQLNFAKNWVNHDVTAVAGIDVRELETLYENRRLYGYNADNLSYSILRYDSAFRTTPLGSRLTIPNPENLRSTTNRYRSWFTNASYTLNDRYTLSVSGRIDQANIFGVKTNQKSIPLWSIGLKWDLEKERFYNISWLPLLKLRGTYGFNGNFLRDGSAYTTAIFNPIATATQGPYASINSPGNPNLRWEKINIINIGVDFSFSKNIISGSIEYYSKKGEDMIGLEPVPSSTGFTNALGNFSNIQGNGVDVLLNTRNINKEITWTSSILFSFATDKVTQYKGTSLTTGFNIIEGRPVQGIYSYHFAGLDPLTGDPLGYLSDTLSKNYSAFSVLKASDKKYNGPANPIAFGGIRNTITYKGFSLSANLSFKFGYYFVRNSINYSNLFTNWQGNIDYRQRWQKPGDENNTTVPSLIYPDNPLRNNFYSGSDALVERGDHIRLQDVNLSYALNEKLLNKIGINNAFVYIYANNIGIVWRANKLGIDPDYRTNFPTPLTISAGIKAGF